MLIPKDRLFISTVAQDAAALARANGLGLELAEYCTASNMDDNFAETDARVREETVRIDRLIMHAPFNELCPAAIDPRARALAQARLLQAADVAARYGITRLVVHSGFIPLVYHKCWQVERSVVFWKELLALLPPGMELCMENVMENEPGMLLDIAAGVADARFGLCLDAGHANVCSRELSPLDWTDALAGYITHFHLHNNGGDWDTHSPLFEGSLDMRAFIERARERCPGATFTIEAMDARSGLDTLFEEGPNAV